MDPSYEFCLEIETFGPADGCAILAAAGEIDVVTAPLLRERLAEFAAAGPVHLIADLSRVTFLDAAGLGALAGAGNEFRRAGGSLALVVTAPRVLCPFRVTG